MSLVKTAPEDMLVNPTFTKERLAVLSKSILGLCCDFCNNKFKYTVETEKCPVCSSVKMVVLL